MSTARQSWLDVIYNKTSITADLAPHLKSWSYTDNLSGQADDLQITVEDRAQLWQGSWFPSRGDTLTATIRRKNWNKDGEDSQLPLGRFEIDEIEVGGPPAEVKIKALSVPQSSPLKGQNKHRAWEKTKLSVIARDIAAGVAMSLVYDVTDDPRYDRIEQTEETDLEFLHRICKEAGLALKISDMQVVIFDAAKYEQAAPTLTIDKKQYTFLSYSGKSTINEVYHSCTIKYKQPKSKTTLTYTFTPPNPPPTQRILVLREHVDSLAEAERKAKKALREKNSASDTYGFTIAGALDVWAGMTVTLKNLGAFDGKWLVTQVSHSQGGGHKVAVQLRRCLEGY